jgi:hypothetical protein
MIGSTTVITIFGSGFLLYQDCVVIAVSSTNGVGRYVIAGWLRPVVAAEILCVGFVIPVNDTAYDQYLRVGFLQFNPPIHSTVLVMI